MASTAIEKEKIEKNPNKVRSEDQSIWECFCMWLWTRWEYIETLLHEYKDCFVWDYNEMVGLSKDLVEHRLPIQEGKKSTKQTPRSIAPEVVTKIKEEVERLFNGKFIWTVRYVDWISNVVPIIKKNGKMCVCIYFVDLNSITPKDEYPMLIC